MVRLAGAKPAYRPYLNRSRLSAIGFSGAGIEEGGAAMSARASQQGSLIVLWAGEDPAVHTSLLEGLDAVGIPYKDLSLGDDEVAPTADPLPIDWKPRFGFEVAVPSGDMTAARQILEKILDREPENLEIPEQDVASSPEPPLTIATELHPSVEVWFGSDDKIAQFLTAAMQENEIPIHIENPLDSTHILVSSANEARAREIVREVTEGAPPQ
jgi:hypothetical protein